MTPLPKKKTARARQGERRNHLKLKAQALVDCPQCHEPRLPHRACPKCGTYAGREVLEIGTKATKKKKTE